MYSNRPQKTLKCGNNNNNISDTLESASRATFYFLPNFDVICDVSLNRHMAP